MKKIGKWMKQKLNKKGAVSIETVIVAALLISLTVGIIVSFSTTIRDSGDKLNTEITKSVDGTWETPE